MSQIPSLQNTGLQYLLCSTIGSDMFLSGILQTIYVYKVYNSQHRYVT
jgi:hypothetical protein